MTDFFDSQSIGTKDFLKKVEMETKPIDEEWVSANGALYGSKVAGDKVQIWRALKGLTDGEARKVITSVKVVPTWKRMTMEKIIFGDINSVQLVSLLLKKSVWLIKTHVNLVHTELSKTELDNFFVFRLLTGIAPRPYVKDYG